jgi:hypothetical protein
MRVAVAAALDAAAPCHFFTAIPVVDSPARPRENGENPAEYSRGADLPNPPSVLLPMSLVAPFRRRRLPARARRRRAAFQRPRRDCRGQPPTGAKRLGVARFSATRGPRACETAHAHLSAPAPRGPYRRPTYTAAAYASLAHPPFRRRRPPRVRDGAAQFFSVRAANRRGPPRRPAYAFGRSCSGHPWSRAPITAAPRGRSRVAHVRRPAVHYSGTFAHGEQRRAPGRVRRARRRGAPAQNGQPRGCAFSAPRAPARSRRPLAVSQRPRREPPAGLIDPWFSERFGYYPRRALWS